MLRIIMVGTHNGHMIRRKFQRLQASARHKMALPSNTTTSTLLSSCSSGASSRHRTMSDLVPSLSFPLLSCIIVSDQIVNSVCWSHALVNGPTSKMSAVCSGSPHSHAALSASPHFFMDALYRPTPVRSRFRVVHCFRLRYSSLTLPPGSDT